MSASYNGSDVGFKHDKLPSMEDEKSTSSASAAQAGSTYRSVRAHLKIERGQNDMHGTRRGDFKMEFVLC